ncbi:MAG: non-hydrolyzing UDP-N-acetylglucosamine 2-epimerase [Beijerinckiaceae bacterium]
MKILSVFGTRPEAIKMAPLVRMLAGKNDLECRICVTGQHRDMLDQVLDIFGILPDYDLAVMKPNQDLTGVTTEVLLGLRDILATEKPDWVLVHGDTTTSMAASMAAFYARCKIGHVEAGLRTGNLLSPYPEEMNRIVTDSMADMLFAPTANARRALTMENISPDKIFVTGNTVIDALRIAVEKVNAPAAKKRFDEQFSFLDPAKRLVLVTAHRRESFGDGIRNICAGLKDIAAARPDIELLYPVHPNPNILQPVHEMLDGIANIHLVTPQEYLPFAYLMDRAALVLTDSGGVQEEAPSLGKPVLVMRDTTERPEAVAAGTVALVGTGRSKIANTALDILGDAELYRRFAQAANPYGDGKASERIVAALRGEQVFEFKHELDHSAYTAAAE